MSEDRRHLTRDITCIFIVFLMLLTLFSVLFNSFTICRGFSVDSALVDRDDDLDDDFAPSSPDTGGDQSGDGGPVGDIGSQDDDSIPIAPPNHPITPPGSNPPPDKGGHYDEKEIDEVSAHPNHPSTLPPPDCSLPPMGNPPPADTTSTTNGNPPIPGEDVYNDDIAFASNDDIDDDPGDDNKQYSNYYSKKSEDNDAKDENSGGDVYIDDETYNNIESPEEKEGTTNSNPDGNKGKSGGIYVITEWTGDALSSDLVTSIGQILGPSLGPILGPILIFIIILSLIILIYVLFEGKYIYINKESEPAENKTIKKPNLNEITTYLQVRE